MCSLKQDSDDQEHSDREVTGDDLFEELLQLNAELEEKGVRLAQLLLLRVLMFKQVKAFGEIEKGSYFANGNWNLEILREDLEMCR